MTTPDEIRAKLRDRQVKPGARGTIEAYVPLDLALLEQLSELQVSLIDARQRAAAEQASPEVRAKVKKRLGEAGAVDVEKVAAEDPEVVDLEAQVETAEAEIRATSLRLVFRSLGSVAYSSLVARHPDADDDQEARNAFLNALAEACLHEVYTADGETVEGLSWAEIAYPNGPESDGPLSYGEWISIVNQLTALNRRVVDLPFSLRSSGQTRS